MSYYVRLIIVILIVLAVAEFLPEPVNAFLILLIASMIIIQSEQFAKLLAQLGLR